MQGSDGWNLANGQFLRAASFFGGGVARVEKIVAYLVNLPKGFLFSVVKAQAFSAGNGGIPIYVTMPSGVTYMVKLQPDGYGGKCSVYQGGGSC